MSAPATKEWRPAHNPWLITIAVMAATFMEVLDTSVANVALPHIAGGLSADQNSATWVLTSYLVSNAIVLPMSGWLATAIGRKRFYMLCVALFTLSSFLCAIAPTLGSLIFFRVLQGVGGGGLQPSEQAILADSFPEEQRGMAFAVYGMAVVLAPAIGPTLGGFITDRASWRWIFFINVPVGVVSLTLTRRVLEDPPWARGQLSKVHIDWTGLALMAAGLGCLQVVLDKGQQEDWLGSPYIRHFAAIGLVALVAMVIRELRCAHPVVDLHLLRRRNFALSFIFMFVLGAVLFGSTVLLQLYVQTVMGYTAEQAGMVLSPGALLVIALLPLVGWMLRKVDPRYLIGIGFLSSALALFHMTGLYPGIDFATAVEYRVYLSFGLAFLFVPINTVSYVGIPPEKSNQISALINLARNLGGSVGIAVATAQVARRSQFHQSHLVTRVTPLEPAYRQLLDALTHRIARGGASLADATHRAQAIVQGLVLREATTLAYIDVFFLFAGAAAVMVLLVPLLRHARGRRPPPGAH
jgi:DHA2 family multidrug resistance protein